MANVTYNRIIRKLVVGFGNLFDNITLVRYNPDASEAERFIVPIAYAAKELYVQRIEGDPNLDKKTQMTLPRMSFNMDGIAYDTSRKQNTNIKNFVQTTTGTVSQYNPVPYNFDFSLYIYVRNVEDGTQIIEHILPYFTPDYTIKLNLIPEMGITKEVPIVLNKTDYEVTYEGDRESDPRIVIWTLTFTVKGFIFGQINNTGLITTSITNIMNNTNANDTVTFNMANTGVGLYTTGEVVYQGYSVNTSTASGTVVQFTNNQLVLSSISGNFISNQSIIGLNSNANYVFTSYNVEPKKYAQIIQTPSPTDANSSTLYTTTTQIFETPNTISSVINTNNFSGDLSTVFGKDDLSTEIENSIDLGS